MIPCQQLLCTASQISSEGRHMFPSNTEQDMNELFHCTHFALHCRNFRKTSLPTSMETWVKLRKRRVPNSKLLDLTYVRITPKSITREARKWTPWYEFITESWELLWKWRGDSHYGNLGFTTEFTSLPPPPSGNNCGLRQFSPQQEIFFFSYLAHFSLIFKK
jgi:hypothetical protein